MDDTNNTFLHLGMFLAHQDSRWQAILSCCKSISHEVPTIFLLITALYESTTHSPTCFTFIQRYFFCVDYENACTNT